MLYDPQHKRGFLYHKLRNVRRTKQKKSKKNAVVTQSDGFQELQGHNVSSDEDELGSNEPEDASTAIAERHSEIMLFLKHAVVKEREDLIKSSLLESVDYRRQLIAEDALEYLKTVKVYISSPNLVRITFYGVDEKNYIC